MTETELHNQSVSRARSGKEIIRLSTERANKMMKWVESALTQMCLKLKYFYSKLKGFCVRRKKVGALRGNALEIPVNTILEYGSGQFVVNEEEFAVFCGMIFKRDDPLFLKIKMSYEKPLS